MTVTYSMVEAGAIALFATNNANGNVELVRARWPSYSDEQKNFYSQLARVVLEAGLAASDV